MRIKIQMHIDIDDEDVKNCTEDDIIEWVLFEYGKRKARRRLPDPLDRFDISFSHEPVFDCIHSIEPTT